MNITLDDLKDFQKQAAGALASMVQAYPGDTFKPRYDQDSGQLMPFLCRLRAITGAGKTPILALTARYLKTGIILWTTNRGAIISQTLANLQSDGKYGSLLPEGTTVKLLSEMGPADWTEAMSDTSGLTVLLATVASFNQEGDKLRVHQQRGDTTYWRMLGGQGPESRKRPLYVFYDEGHGATEKQFTKLRELDPKAFVLASASPLPDDLADLLSGKTDEERSNSLKARTVLVPTREVVKAGLLKNRLYFVDCNTAQTDAIAEAHIKWQELLGKLSEHGHVPIACFIVNDTPRGVDVWEALVKLGVPKGRIAVHLNKAEDVIVERHGMIDGLIDTLKLKKTPDQLRDDGYTHIIWNLSLREGWDEPLAYIAYLDSHGKSTTDMVQKIGRFVRQPEAQPFDDPDLNAAYFYFNVSDEEFTALLHETQEEMEVDGYEIISIRSGKKAPQSQETPAVRPKTVPGLSESFGEDINKLDNILLKAVPSFSEDALRAKGIIRTRVMDMQRLAEDESLRSKVERDGNDVVTPWDYLTTRLAAIDSRIITSTGTRFSSGLKDHPKMRQQMQHGSEAMETLDNAVGQIRDQLNDELRLHTLGKRSVYTPPPFNLVSPDMDGGNERQRERYKVRRYKHAVHEAYNGLNPFEVKVAEALDASGLTWCRNPNKGYGIPITELGAGTTRFYPDFLLWTDTEVWAIDPKGVHLTQEAVTRKLLDLGAVAGIETPIRVALVLEGSYVLNASGSPTKNGKEGVTLVKKTSSGTKALHLNNLHDLVKALVEKR